MQKQIILYKYISDLLVLYVYIFCLCVYKICNLYKSQLGSPLIVFAEFQFGFQLGNILVRATLETGLMKLTRFKYTFNENKKTKR